jgi:hypothetical protein
MRGGVFVCHASDDAGTAQRAVAALEAAGIPCWIAPRDIEAGETYTQAILDGLDAAPAIVLIFSSATNESPHVARELEAAVGSSRRIIPVRLEQVEPSRSLRYLIGTAQWLDASGAAEAWWSPTLVRAVRRAIGQPEPEPGSAGAVPAGSAVPPAVPPPTPTPAPPAPTEPGPPATGTAGRRNALIVAGAVAAVVVAVVATNALTRGGEPGHTAEDRSAPQPPATGSSASGAQVTGKSAGQQTGPVTCWDQSRANSVKDCPVPTGREGMAAVFPGLDDSCTIKDSPIEGKAEVYECLHDGFVVRYTRWDEGFDKAKYYDVENEVASQEWQIDGEDAGLQWFSVEHDPAEEQPYQWSAAYAGLPFSLSVEGETQEDRSSGLTELVLVPPSEVGLAPQQ